MNNATSCRKERPRLAVLRAPRAASAGTNGYRSFHLVLSSERLLFRSPITIFFAGFDVNFVLLSNFLLMEISED